MPVKVYDGTNWVTVAGDGAQGATGASGTAPLTTKGDLLGFDTAANRVAVGTDGQSLVAGSTATAGIRWQDTYAAGKNKIINGDFGVWQRGTSFAAAANNIYTADRWTVQTSGTGVTISQQTFTPATAPVSGYEGTYFLRVANDGTSATARIGQPIEDVRVFAGQTVTLSFWAKSATADAFGTSYILQTFGSGGSTQVATSLGTMPTLTSSWARYSITVAVPSVSGKTIGTSSSITFQLRFKASAAYDIDLWGVQLESGSVATPFTTATGTIQGELAACQRYYYQSDAQIWTNLQYQSNVAVSRGTTLFLPQFMRVAPTLTFFDSPGTSGRVSVSASSGGYSDNITPNVFGQNSNAYAYYVSGSYVLGYTSKITASAEL
jgi:hypothetical protein